MELIFWGLLFVFLDFTVNLDGAAIGLIPDFVGYIFLIRGSAQLADASSRFAKISTPALAMAIYTGILYGMDLFGITANLGVLGWVLRLATLIVTLWISYLIVQGVAELETFSFRDLQSASLRSLWIAHAVLAGINYLLSWVPVLGIVCLLAKILVTVFFLMAFYQSKKAYQNG